MNNKLKQYVYSRRKFMVRRRWRLIKHYLIALPIWKILSFFKPGSQPLISVIIPVKNVAPTLAQTLQCLQAQTFKYWEAIIVDDGSTDDTASIASTFVQNDARIRLVTQPYSQGVSAARNRGLSETTAPWVMFLDGDDWVVPHYFSYMLATLRQYSTDVVYCGSTRIFSDGSLLTDVPGIAMTYIDELEDRPFYRMAQSCPIAIHSVITRRKTIEAAGAFEVGMANSEDWDFWFRVARTGATFVGLPLLMAYYRMRSEPSTSDNYQAMLDAIKILQLSNQVDPRVIRPAAKYRDGIGQPDAIRSRHSVALFFAGLTAGAGVSALRLLKVYPSWPQFCTQKHLNIIVGATEAGVSMGARKSREKLADLYPSVAPFIKEIFEFVEQACAIPGTARLCIEKFERMILGHASLDAPRQLSTTHGTQLDLTQPIGDFTPQPGNSRLYLRVAIKGQVVAEFDCSASFRLDSCTIAKSILANWWCGSPQPDISDTDWKKLWRSNMKTLLRRTLPLRHKLLMIRYLASVMRQAQQSLNTVLPDDEGQISQQWKHWQGSAQRTAIAKGFEKTIDRNHQNAQRLITSGEIANKIPVLMYHSISSTGPAGLSQWRCHPDEFEQQLHYLQQNGFYAITSVELLAMLRGERKLYGKPVLISFDDGYTNFADLAWPLIKKYGFTAEMFVVTDFVGKSAQWDTSYGTAAPLMSWPTLRELQSDGVVFGSHLATHRRADRLSLDELIEEAMRSRFALQSRMGCAASSAAYPFGILDQRTVRALEWAGYDIAYTVNDGFVTEGMFPLLLPRIEVTGFDRINTFAEKVGGTNNTQVFVKN